VRAECCGLSLVSDRFFSYRLNHPLVSSTQVSPSNIQVTDAEAGNEATGKLITTVAAGSSKDVDIAVDVFEGVQNGVGPKVPWKSQGAAVG